MNHPLSQHRRHKLLSTNYWPAEITRRTSCVLRMGQGLFAQQQLCIGPWQESSYFFPMERPTTTKGTRALITYKREMADQINTQNERTVVANGDSPSPPLQKKAVLRDVGGPSVGRVRFPRAAAANPLRSLRMSTSGFVVFVTNRFIRTSKYWS